jgi:nitroreductase/NAD-dependent dihydropyrimidine dehydrogenase PreA subunit
MALVEIDATLCQSCGTCVASCPETVYVHQQKGSVPQITHPDLCISCGQCVAICPEGAITHEDFPLGTVSPIDRQVLPSADQILETIKTRRSIRAFRKKPVERDLIERIIDGARFAPSAHNVQSTEFTVVQDKEVRRRIVDFTSRYLEKTSRQLHNPILRRLLLMLAREAIEGALELLPDFDRIVKEVRKGKDTILFDAPVVVFFHASQRIDNSDVNATLALQNAALVTHSLGLGGFYAGYVVSACQRDDRIPRLLEVPREHRVYGALALGYPKFKFKNWIERRTAKIRWI